MRAVVDIGSNSIKYTLERVWGDASSQVSNSRVIALGKNLNPGDALSSEALGRLESALKEFSPELSPCKPNIVVVGTAALRNCSNPNAASNLVSKYLAAELHVIPGKTEAKLSFLGASLNSPFKNPLCIDVGGASTEVGLICTSDENNDWATSVSWGALRVHENILNSCCPVPPEIWATAQDTLDEIFAKELGKVTTIDTKKIDGVLAIGGSLIMCAKSLYSDQVSSKTIKASMKKLREFNEKIATSNLKTRSHHLGFSPDRAEISCAGLMCLFAATSFAQNIDNALITEGGLRHGVFARWQDFQ
jgi:exopolyphosphatase / guanosine-5'-triphosphate,3'-diphosphate pyrophosphatase